MRQYIEHTVSPVLAERLGSNNNQDREAIPKSSMSMLVYCFLASW
jgi:hypothetical protein